MIFALIVDGEEIIPLFILSLSRLSLARPEQAGSIQAGLAFKRNSNS